jgi:hypothetical protein
MLFTKNSDLDARKLRARNNDVGADCRKVEQILYRRLRAFAKPKILVKLATKNV